MYLILDVVCSIAFNPLVSFLGDRDEKHKMEAHSAKYILISVILYSLSTALILASGAFGIGFCTCLFERYKLAKLIRVIIYIATITLPFLIPVLIEKIKNNI